MKTQSHSKKMSMNGGGFTLVECMLAAAILVVILAGIMTFRYYTVFSAEAAENQLLAARAACLLSEAWRGQKADTAFDPMQQDFEADFQISPLAALSDKVMTGLTTLGNYQIQMDGKDFQAHLLYGNAAGVHRLRSIHVVICWRDYRGVRHEYHLPTLSQTTA